MNISKAKAAELKAQNSVYNSNNTIVFYDCYVPASDQPKVNAAIRKVAKGNVKEYVAFGNYLKKGQVHKSISDLYAESYKGTASIIIYVRAHAVESDWVRENVPPKSEKKTEYVHTYSDLIYFPEKFGNNGKESVDVHNLCSNCSQKVTIYEIDPSVEVVQAINVSEEFFAHKEIEYSVLEKEYAELAGVSRAIARETLKWARHTIVHAETWSDPDSYDFIDLCTGDEEVINFLVDQGLILEDTHICPECGHLVSYKLTRATCVDTDTGYNMLGHIDQQCPFCFINLDETELNPQYEDLAYDVKLFKEASKLKMLHIEQHNDAQAVLAEEQLKQAIK